MTNLNITLKNNFMESSKGLFISGFVLFKSIVKLYIVILMYLILWPMFLMNWLVNGNKEAKQ